MSTRMASNRRAGASGSKPFFEAATAKNRCCLAEQPCVGIGSGGIRVILAFLAVEVALGITAAAAVAGRRLPRCPSFGTKLFTGPGFDQRAVNREVLTR